MAALMFFKWLAPRCGMPWQPRASLVDRLRRLIWIAGFPVLALAALLDLALAPLARAFKIAGYYRVVARRVERTESAAAFRRDVESPALQFQ
jgi:hypothetical protein